MACNANDLHLTPESRHKQLRNALIEAEVAQHAFSTDQFGYVYSEFAFQSLLRQCGPQCGANCGGRCDYEKKLAEQLGARRTAYERRLQKSR